MIKFVLVSGRSECNFWIFSLKSVALDHSSYNWYMREKIKLILLKTVYYISYSTLSPNLTNRITFLEVGKWQEQSMKDCLSKCLVTGKNTDNTIVPLLNNIMARKSIWQNIPCDTLKASLITHQSHTNRGTSWENMEWLWWPILVIFSKLQWKRHVDKNWPVCKQRWKENKLCLWGALSASGLKFKLIEFSEIWRLNGLEVPTASVWKQLEISLGPKSKPKANSRLGMLPSDMKSWL